MTSDSRHRLQVLALWTVILVQSAFAATPTIDRIDQSTGGRRGTEFTVRIEGYELASVKDVLFFEKGIELRSIRHPAEGMVDVTLSSSKDCRLGEHPFVLLTNTSRSEVRTLHIGPFDIRAEKEPNSSLQSAQTISLPVTVTGVVEERDQDWYRVHLASGEPLSAEVVAMPLSRYLFDAALELVDADGNLLLRADDGPLLRQDPVLTFVAPRDGDYFLKIQEAAFGGDLDSRYRIHLGNFPRPTIAYPPGVTAGTPTKVRLLGDATGEIATTLTLQGRSGQIQSVHVGGEYESPCHVKVRCSDLTNFFESEPNDSISTATMATLETGCALNGIIQRMGDADHFAFDARAGDAFEIQTFAARIGSPIDTQLVLYDPDGNELARNDDGFVHDSLIRFHALRTGRYTLQVRDHLLRGGETAVYRVEFTPIKPKLDIRLPTTTGSMPQQMQSVVVPRGATVPLLISCRRQDFQGNVRLQVDGLPAGVTVEARPIESDTHLGVALFSASPDAALGVSLIRLFGQGDSPAGPVYGEFTQTVGLVFGQPRKTVYHAVELDRFPVQIIESAPFSLRVIQPHSPLVQQGRLDLLVEVERQAGFASDITLSLAHAPPWIRGPESPVVVTDKASSVRFSLFADKSASLREWPIVLVAKANTKLGQLTLAANPVQLRTARPFVSLDIEKSVVDQGARSNVKCALDWTLTEHLDDSQDEMKNSLQLEHSAVTATLRGLPKGAKAAPQSVSIGQSSIDFPVDVSLETPPAAHNSLYVELTVPQINETVTHFLGHGGVLEVLEPGAKPLDERSRLQVLRATNDSEPRHVQ